MMRRWCFLIYLITAAWQDYRTKTIDGRLLWIGGCAGLVICILEERLCLDVILACGVGLALLGLGFMTKGGIGDGDGWFFVVSGMYLTLEENMWLLCSGFFLCFLWSLPVAVYMVIQKGNGRKRGVPFLPFLLPAGIWLVVW